MELISEWGSRSEGQELRSGSRTDFSELLRDNYNFAKSDTKFAIIPLLSDRLSEVDCRNYASLWDLLLLCVSTSSQAWIWILL